MGKRSRLKRVRFESTRVCRSACGFKAMRKSPVQWNSNFGRAWFDVAALCQVSRPSLRARVAGPG
eukprot:9380993-Alexandrium_andersonii.AAC.1